MIKILTVIALVFLVVYTIYCGIMYVLKQNTEEQVKFLELFINGLQALSFCFAITAAIVMFIVVNF